MYYTNLKFNLFCVMFIQRVEFIVEFIVKFFRSIHGPYLKPTKKLVKITPIGQFLVDF